MTPDELRALADALEPMARAPRFEDFDVPAFCAWLRAQAEAEPVAWIVEHGPTRRLTFFDEAPGKVGSGVSIPLYTHPAPTAPHHAMLDSRRRLVEQAIQSAEHPSGMSTHDGKARIDASILRRMLAIIDSLSAVPAGWKLVPVEPTPEMLSAVGMMDGYDWHAPGCSPDADHANWYSAMIAAAPAAPQAEPKPTPASDDDLNVYKEMADNYQNDAQAEPKREPTGAPYGIIDPDYGRVYTIARKLAWEEGYAIGLHGSFTRDLDLIAVPWTDTACEPEHLIRRIVDATGLKLRDGVAVKPHGRRAWTLKFPTFGDPRFVDLSVMPRIGGSDGN